MTSLRRAATILFSTSLLGACAATKPLPSPEPVKLADGCALFDPLTRQTSLISGCLELRQKTLQHEQTCAKETAELTALNDTMLTMLKAAPGVPAQNLAIVLWVQKAARLQDNCGETALDGQSFLDTPLSKRQFGMAREAVEAALKGRCSRDLGSSSILCNLPSPK